MPADMHRARDLFLHAVGKLPPEQWDAYVAGACGADGELLGYVAHLLAVHRQAGSFLEQPAADVPLTGPFLAPPGAGADTAPAEGPGTHIGPYRLVQPLGEGGMGMVFVAHQDQPVRRRVALKVIKPGMDSRAVVARFEAERQALALMDHPHIAKVLDGGTTAGGRPYFVMELVEGVPLTDFCDRERLTPRERLGLFVSVCRAVQHAHQKGIIHRDLKPSNVLASVQDGVAAVKVIDFGVAKALQQRLTDKTLLTGAAQVVGTPLYMSPEQAEPGGLDIDTRSDIYSLGVLLYELLTGTTPFERERLSQASLEELRRIIREEEPPRPSARVSTLGPAAQTLSEQRQTDPRQLGQLLRGELDWVVMKCLEKDRTRRYETADALAKDVARYLADEPVEACPPSATYRLGKFLRKHRRGLLTGGAFLALVVAGGVLVGWQAVREAEAERDRVVEKAQRGAAVREALERGRALRAEARKGHDPGKWAKAREQAQRALALVESGPADEALKAQVRQAQDELDQEERDRQLVADLETARLAQGATVGHQNRFAPERAIPLYRKALRAYGLPVGEGDPAAAAARLSGRPPEVRQAVSAVLDEWLDLAAESSYQVREPQLAWLRVLAAVGQDEGGMREMRAAVGEGDSTRRRAALRRLAAAADVRRWPPRALAHLARRLRVAQATPSAVQLLRRAWRQYPEDFWVNEDLGTLLSETRRWEEAVRHLMVAVALRPDSPGARVNLGRALEKGGHRDEAIACYRQAIDRDPKLAAAYYNLGVVLDAKGQVEEAIACYRQAIDRDPNFAAAHHNLGSVLGRKGQLDKAIACFRTAVELDPKDAQAHASLGKALGHMGQLDEAIACLRTAVELDPNFAAAHSDLALALYGKGQVDEAIACSRKAVELDPNFAGAYYNLGCALGRKGQVDQAIACYRKAVELDPNFAGAYYNLGCALDRKGQVDQAIAYYRRVIEIDPNHAEAHCNLGGALLGKGDFRAALASYRTGHALGSRRKDWRYPSAQWVKQCERCVQLDDLLAAALKGKARPAGPAECLELADFCLFRMQRPAAAVRFYTEAFTAEPKRAADLQAGHRYHAALSAALAGSSRGRDAADLSAAERTRLRRQALRWLRADLASWTKQLENGSAQACRAARARMQAWLSDPGLAGVRDAPGLAALPAGERRTWQAFWADVKTIRTKDRSEK
jgi:serine/threonine-protein kinase